jgi:D-alanyl-D-alanine dipeptidase
MAEQKPVTAADLVPLDAYTDSHPIRIDLVYAQPHHPDNMFKTAIYKPDARMWGHRVFVPVILKAAETCHRETGWYFELKDCLRTIEAQAAMAQTDIVKANPHWLEEPNRLLSPPGKGGHPRGQAVDIILIDANGEALDMGTPFDYLTPDRTVNPAARSYRDLSAEVLLRRQQLESWMMQAAASLGLPLWPLPQEWWDFRFTKEYYDQYAPVADADLPPDMRVTF